MAPPDLAALRSIPSMGGHRIAAYLYELGLQHQGRGEVVEVGSWLGASCAPIALGLKTRGSTAGIHCFDRFSNSEEECERARKQGVNIDPGQDTTPIFLANVRPIYPNITAYKTKISRITWDGRPIEVYIDDASKKRASFVHVLRTFGPSFIPGLTTIVLMDFNLYRRKHHPPHLRRTFEAQKQIVDRLGDHLREVFTTWPRASAVAFRYEKAFDFRELSGIRDAAERGRHALSDAVARLFRRGRDATPR
jgi:hypothetical protein